jgi:hypothetical protein
LRIVVNGEYAFPPASKCHSKVESGGALPHSPLSVCYCDDGGHRWLFLVSLQWYREVLPWSKGLIPFLLRCNDGLGCRYRSSVGSSTLTACACGESTGEKRERAVEPFADYKPSSLTYHV